MITPDSSYVQCSLLLFSINAEKISQLHFRLCNCILIKPKIK